MTLPAFTTRRRRERTCTDCGAALEVILPGPSYHLLSLVVAILVEIAALALLLLLLGGLWVWAVLVVGTFAAINFLFSAFLNSRARVRLKEPPRKDVPGRWYSS